jgi:hypothetical protein
MLVIGNTCTIDITVTISKYSHERVNRTKLREHSRNNTYRWKVLSLTQLDRCESERLQEGERDRMNARFESSKSIEYMIEKNYDR